MASYFFFAEADCFIRAFGGQSDNWVHISFRPEFDGATLQIWISNVTAGRSASNATHYFVTHSVRSYFQQPVPTCLTHNIYACSNTLYPKLEDHQLVLNYPDVRGMHKNVFFLSHAHREVGGGEDAVSKHNAYEVSSDMRLVVYNASTKVN